MEDELTIVIPAFNERVSLVENLGRWLEECSRQGWRLVVVDDGSTDGTDKVLAEHAAHPRLSAFRHRGNRGYGNALKTGLCKVETPLAATLDADGQHRLEDVTRLLEALRSQHADMVIGARAMNDTSGAYRRLGKGLIRRIARLLFGVCIRDLNSGFKLYRTDLVQRLLPWCPGSMAFSDVVTLLHLNMDLIVVEIPVETDPRKGGHSTISTMTAIDTVLEIVNVLMWFKPLKVFLPVAGLLMLVGAAWAIPLLLAGRGMSGASLLVLVSGMMVGMLGLIAEQIAHLRHVELPHDATERIVPA